MPIKENKTKMKVIKMKDYNYTLTFCASSSSENVTYQQSFSAKSQDKNFGQLAPENSLNTS